MLAVACGAIVVFFPFFWMAVTSLKTPPEIQRVPLQVAPDDWLNFENYVEVFKREPFFRYLLNSAIVATIAASAASSSRRWPASGSPSTASRAATSSSSPSSAS